METQLFNVKGMSCAGCVASVTRVLKAVPGVTEADVQLAAGTARVTYDPVRADVPALRSAIEGAGYAVTA